jgi:hypothetical protein
MVRLSRVNFAFPLPQFEAIADIRARVIQNAGYTNCCDIIISFEILTAMNVILDSEANPICGHRWYSLLGSDRT